MVGFVTHYYYGRTSNSRKKFKGKLMSESERNRRSDPAASTKQSAAINKTKISCNEVKYQLFIIIFRSNMKIIDF